MSGKILKPGQLITIKNIRYRVKKREDGCKGCALDDITLCPCVVDRRLGGEPKYNCFASGIILKREAP